jgi:hypothetical protein
MHAIAIGNHTAHFNSDFSGDVVIDGPGEFDACVVPFEVMKKIVAYYVRDKKIEALAEGSDDEILGVR